MHFALTLDEAGRAGLRLDYASRRIDEAVTLVEENRTQALDQVLADYNDQIQSELTLLQPGSPLTADQQLALADAAAAVCTAMDQAAGTSIRSSKGPAIRFLLVSLDNDILSSVNVPVCISKRDELAAGNPREPS